MVNSWAFMLGKKIILIILISVQKPPHFCPKITLLLTFLIFVFSYASIYSDLPGQQKDHWDA